MMKARTFLLSWAVLFFLFPLVLIGSSVEVCEEYKNPSPIVQRKDDFVKYRVFAASPAPAEDAWAYSETAV